MQTPSLQDSEKAIDAVQAKTADAASGLADRLKGALSSAQASSDDLAGRVKSTARELSDSAVAGFDKTRACAEDAMTSHPWRSAMIIGMAGLVVGALFRNMPRHR